MSRREAAGTRPGQRARCGYRAAIRRAEDRASGAMMDITKAALRAAVQRYWEGYQAAVDDLQGALGAPLPEPVEPPGQATVPAEMPRQRVRPGGAR